MKIAIIGNKFEDSLEFNLKIASQKMGFNVEIFDFTSISNIYKNSKIKFFTGYALKMFSSYNQSVFSKLAYKVVDHKPDLVIATWRFINPIFVDIVKKELKHTKIVHLNPDAVTTFGRQEVFMSNYDAFFTKCHYIERFMKNKLGLNVFYLPESFNPFYHKKPEISKKDAEEKINIDVMMIGSLYGYRYKFIENLINRGVNVNIFGNKLSYIKSHTLDKYFMNEYVTGERKSSLFYGSKIVLNNFHYAEIESVNCKFFEIAGSGGVQLCDDNVAVGELLDKEKEVFTFKSAEDAVEKIDFLLKNPKIRYEVSSNVYKRAVEEHTYENRINTIIKTVF